MLCLLNYVETANIPVSYTHLDVYKRQDRGYVIENGRIVLEGKSSDLLQDPTVQGFYLGGMSGESSQGA